MKPKMTNKGFTLVEILVAVLIMIILVTMAMPMYERAIEKSRVAEVSIALKRLNEAKLRSMDNMGILVWTPAKYGFGTLDIENPSNNMFTYSLAPSSFPNAVCATKVKGNNAGVSFLYVSSADCACKLDSTKTETSYICKVAGCNTVCQAFCEKSEKLFCSTNGKTGVSCEDYGLSDSGNDAKCN